MKVELLYKRMRDCGSKDPGMVLLIWYNSLLEEKNVLTFAFAIAPDSESL